MKDALSKIPGKVTELLEAHDHDLKQAWANVGDEGLSISFTAKIGVDKKRIPVCEVSIAFFVERVKDSLSFKWSDKQIDLPIQGLKAVGK